MGKVVEIPQSEALLSPREPSVYLKGLQRLDELREEKEWIARLRRELDILERNWYRKLTQTVEGLREDLSITGP